jgi:hypothetical protein
VCDEHRFEAVRRRRGWPGRHDLRHGASWLVSAAVLCVSLARLACLFRDAPCLTAHGERTWLEWSYRHPDPEDLFRRIGARLRPGEAITVTAPLAEYEAYWWHGMGSYFMWEHPIAELLNRRRPLPAPRRGRPLVIISSHDQIRVLRQPPA